MLSVILEISLCFPHGALAIYPGVDSKTTLSPFLTSSHPAEGTNSLNFKMHTMTPRASKQTSEKQTKLYAERRKRISLFLWGRKVREVALGRIILLLWEMLLWDLFLKVIISWAHWCEWILGEVQLCSLVNRGALQEETFKNIWIGEGGGAVVGTWHSHCPGVQIGFLIGEKRFCKPYCVAN